MTLTLTYQAQTSIPVEVEGFTPAWIRDRSLAEIERFEILHGSQALPLAEMFRVEGDPDDQRVVFQGDLSGVHWIGAGMSEGEIHVEGSAGRHVGSGLRGGKIIVDGDVGDWLGAEMQKGSIHVRHNAGNRVGASYVGSPKGMAGGTILVEGNAGLETGRAMRRGLIAIGGDAGDMLGYDLLAGTILVFGDCGLRPAAGMRRGTVGLLGPAAPVLLPTFRYACKTRLQVLSLLFERLQQFGWPKFQSDSGHRYNVFNGDSISLGKGEVFTY